MQWETGPVSPVQASQPQLLPLPWASPADPATFCVRVASMQRASGKVPVPSPPVLWLARLPGPWLPQGKSAPELPHAPLWWAGGGWREFSEASAALPAAYAPRRFQPPWIRGAGLLRPLEAPGEAGPDEGHAQALGSGPSTRVLRVLRMLICEWAGALWARPQVGGAWCQCPHSIAGLSIARLEAFEVCGGNEYIVLLHDTGAKESTRGTPSLVLTFSLTRNEWCPTAGATRAFAGRHGGEAPVRWRPVPGHRPSNPAPPMHAWLIEATPDYLVLLSPVARDGAQRDGKDVHSALHFIGVSGEVISHHMAVSAKQLTIQRYDEHLLLFKDSERDADGDADCLDDDWNPSHQRVAGWLLSVKDVAVPPLPVFLPSAEEGWLAGASSWSLALAWGCLEDFASSWHLRSDMAPRLYLLESGPMLRLWASRVVDEDYGTVLQRHSLDGKELLRHALTFAPLQQTLLEVDGHGLAAVETAPTWMLWSPDLRHAVRLRDREQASFWRCAGASRDGESSALKASATHARLASVGVAETISTAEVFPRSGDWDSCALPWEAAHGAEVVT
eukprot:CAMPEP_0170569820 /NCGR_PEP_ID=MMETSP0224-20130122/766_1 /TAXON_ID=285029 /ORGANISM="Togula jolla, Strain CCCM 725" /LENGTH=560 /DNA_ID=CAMNT_0010892027 /DNA_START=76 /DNA_END=1754 /DNA_ORIENTATION=-